MSSAKVSVKADAAKLFFVCVCVFFPFIFTGDPVLKYWKQTFSWKKFFFGQNTAWSFLFWFCLFFVLNWEPAIFVCSLETFIAFNILKLSTRDPFAAEIKCYYLIS